MSQLFTSSSWFVIDQCQTNCNKKQKHTNVNFSALVWTKHPRCSDGKQLLVWCILLSAVHMATRPSNLERSATREFWVVGLSDLAATQA